MTCFPGEQLGLGGNRSAMMEFSDFISELGLLDISLVGGLYTWLNLGQE